MKRKEMLQVLLLLFVAETLILVVSSVWIDYVWYVEGLLGGLALLYFMLLSGRISKNQVKYFTPLACGISLIALGLFLMYREIDFLLGMLGLFLDITGMALLLFGFYCLRKVKVGVNMPSNKQALEAKTSETLKSFLKKCVKCDREIPIASEQCPFCGQTQP